MSLGSLLGRNAGFQLFIQSDNSDGVYANAAARDVYFGANPSELARLDNNQFLIIKLLDDGSGSVAYQQRSASAWVDVTSLVQGEAGPAGATGNSFFFESIAARDTFFTTGTNYQLLKNGLPIAVNVGDYVQSNYSWGGVSTPGSYDATLWRLAPLEISSGTLFLGVGGASISSGAELLNFTAADGDTFYLHGVAYDDTGSSEPAFWKLPSISQIPLADVSDTTLTDPQAIGTTNTINAYVKEYTLIPATAGTLRVQTWLGTDETGAELVDTYTTVSAGDVGNQTPFSAPNNTLVKVGQATYTKFSGVQLKGGLQTSGTWAGQTTPFITLGAWVASQSYFITTDDSASNDESILYFDGITNEVTSDSNLTWNGSVLGINGRTAATGPSTSTANSLAFWEDTAGTELGSSTITYTIVGSKDGRLDIEPVLNTGKSILTLSNEGGGTGLQVEHDDATDVSSIIGEIGTLTVSTTVDDLILSSAEDINLSAGGNDATVKLTSSSTATNLEFFPTVAAPTTLIKMNDSNGDQAFRIRRQTDAGGVFVDNDIGPFNIRQLATGGSLLLSSSDGNIQITPPTGSQTVVNTQSRFANNGTINDFRVRIPAADGEAVISLESAVSTPVLELKYDDDTSNISITGNSGTLTIENTATNADIEVKTNGTGDFIFNDNYYLIGSPTTASMRIDSPVATGQAKIQFVSSTSFTKMDLEYNENLDELEFTVTDTPLIIRGNENVFLQSTAGNLSLEASGSGFTGIIEIESDEALILKSNDNKIQVESGSGVGTPVISLADTSATRLSRIYVENDSPIDSIAATGGDLTFRDDGVESAIYLKKSDTSSDDWYTVSVNPPNMIEINNAVELAALATASVITISENTTFVFHNDVTTLVRFVLTNNATLYFVSPPQADYNFAGAGTLFSGTGAINISDITFVAYAGGTFMELVSNNDKEIVLTRVLVGGFKLGSITKDTDNFRGPAFTMQNVRFFGWNTTLVLTDVILLAADNFTAFQPNEVPRNIPCINIKTTVPWIAPQFSLQRVQGSLIGTETLLEVDSGISTDTRVQITNSPMLGDNLFETASTATGIFTAVADASKSAEAITSVIDSGGEARFAIAASGATVEVGQWVVHSGFTTNTDYNGNLIVTTTTGHTYHASPYGAGGDAVAFGSNETGTLNTDSVEITDASHGLSEGDSLNIYTNDSIDYDGGYQVLSGETTNTFRINAVWTQTQTGTWSNGGLDQTDEHVLANNNPSFKDSVYLAFAHCEENTTLTNGVSDTYNEIDITGATDSISAFATNGAGGTTVTTVALLVLENQNVVITGTTNYNGTWTIFNRTTSSFDIAVAFVTDDATGDWVSGLICEDERFKCIDPAKAVITYTGHEPFSGSFKCSLVTTKTGSSQLYHFSAGVNGDQPVQGASYIKREVTNTASVTAYSVPVDLVYGDTVQPCQAGVGTGNNFLISNIQIEIS